MSTTENYRIWRPSSEGTTSFQTANEQRPKLNELIDKYNNVFVKDIFDVEKIRLEAQQVMLNSDLLFL